MCMEMSCMQKVIRRIRDKAPKIADAIKTKRGWTALIKEGRYAGLGEEIQSAVVAVVHEALEKPTPSQHLFALRKRIGFSLVRNEKRIWPYRMEEALERYIVNSNAGCHNQFLVYRKKESVDLVRVIEGKHCFIELKPWTDVQSKDNPLYAAIESIKNYLFWKLNDASRIGAQVTQLAVLAPRAYYEHHDVASALPLLECIAQMSSAKLGVPLRFYRFDLDLDRFVNQCVRLDGRSGDWSPAKSKRLKKTFDSRKTVEPGTMDVIPELKFERWVEIGACV